MDSRQSGDQPGVAAMKETLGVMDKRVRAMIHGLARRRSARGEVGIRGYWPESNNEPLFEVYGGWMTADELRWIAEQAKRIAR